MYKHDYVNHIINYMKLQDHDRYVLETLSIMLTLCLKLSHAYNAQNYAAIIGTILLENDLDVT